MPLERHFGTTEPTRELISRKLNFLASIGRGRCIYINVFASGRPGELFFGGYSID